MSARSDRELIAAAVRGEVSAFVTLLGRYRDVHTRFAIRMLGGYEAADEALQISFVRAYQSLAKCKEADRFGDWLYRIVISECRGRALRKVVRERRLTGEMEAAPESSAAVEDFAAMQRVVDQIDPAIREPFLLQYVEELPYSRMALLTGASVQALERQVDRACARLRELMPASSSTETRLSSAGLELLSSEAEMSLAVRVAIPLRRPEVLNDSFEDRLMPKLLRPGTPTESGALPAIGASISQSVPAVHASNAPEVPNDSARPDSRRLYIAIAGVAACLALAAFITGYAARRWRDVRDVEGRRPVKPIVVPKIIKHTDTLRVARTDTIVLARFALLDAAAHSVAIVGDFNDWNPESTSLQGMSKGSWSTTLTLAPGRYEYAFLVDGKRWVVDRFSRATHEELGVQTSVMQFGSAEPAVISDGAAARTRLRKVLPHDIADRLLAKISSAKEQGLPAATLEQRALEFAAKRVAPKDIEHAIASSVERLTRARGLLSAGDRSKPTAGELIATAEVLRRGGDSTVVVALARAVPSRRSLATPMEVVAQLIGGGMSAAEAADKVRTRVHNEATDAALQHWADETMVKLVSRPPEKAKAKVAKAAGTTEVRQAGAPANKHKKTLRNE